MNRVLGAYLLGVGTMVLGAVVAKRWAMDAAGIALVGAGAYMAGLAKHPPKWLRGG